ncbi:MAG: hypothetical protein B6241_14200 [Spirochaetaceae bacterium 4572_59]|nr:MAG: hypothetical protein B6241_14200 [Spirochaetaceae bacterium 4572_59]
MYRLFVKFFIPVLMSIIILMPLFSEDSDKGGGETLSFSDLVKDVERSSGYKIALREYEEILKEERFYNHPGDADFTVQPGMKNQKTDWGTEGQTDLTMSAGVSFFLGRSRIQEDKYRRAVRAVETGQMELSSTRNEELYSLYVLYTELWLQQQEEPVLTDEKTLAESRYDRFLQLYENGAAILTDMEDAEDELQLAEDSLNQNMLKQRLTWYTLLQARGGLEYEQFDDIPILDEFYFDVPSLDKPGILTGRVLEASAERQKQINTIISLSETEARLKQPDWNLQLKPYFTYDDHDWALSYNWENRNLDLNYAFPLATYNEFNTQTSSVDWVTGISIILSLGTGKSDSLERDVYMSEIQRQEELLQEQSEKLSLELRSVYQQLLQAFDSLEQAETSLLRQSRIKEAVNTRYDAGQALKTDLFSADTAENRSRWKKANAQIEVQQSYFSLMVLTGDLSFIAPP